MNKSVLCITILEGGWQMSKMQSAFLKVIQQASSG